MRKFIVSCIFALCLIHNGYAFLTLGTSDIEVYKNNGYLVSNDFLSYANCLEQKNNYDRTSPNYKRTDCFSNSSNSFNYFICNNSDKCDIGGPQTETKKYYSIPNQDILDKFIEKVKNLHDTLSDEQYTLTINSINNTLTSLGNKYKSSQDILSMLNYLQTEINKLQNNGVSSFLSDLGSSLSGTNNIISSQKQLGDYSTNNNITTNTLPTPNANQTLGVPKGCSKFVSYGDVSICDSQEKKNYSQIKSSCPSGYHVPNYWEMDYLLKSKIDLTKFNGGKFFINSLYREVYTTMESTFPFYNSPYIYTNGNINFDSQISVANEEKFLCIKNDKTYIPTTSSYYVSACSLSSYTKLNTMKGKYNVSQLNRSVLFNDESLILESNNISGTGGNYNYSLKISCTNNTLTDKEEITQVNSCKYGYVQAGNACIVNVGICNKENLGNTNPTTGQICSWRELGSIDFQTKKTYRYGLSVMSSDETAANEITTWSNDNKNTLLQQYSGSYNNKVDIDVNCNALNEIYVPNSYKDYNITQHCGVKGLFWQ